MHNDPEARLLIVDEADYDALMPRCALVIHHGGSGTVAAALRAGVPCVVRPYIGSQQRYASLLVERGVCTAVLDAQKLTAEELTRVIVAGANNAGARQAARRLRDALMIEDGFDGLRRAASLIELHARALAISRKLVTIAGSVADENVPPAGATNGSGLSLPAEPAQQSLMGSPATARPEQSQATDGAKALDAAAVLTFYQANFALFAGRKLFQLRRIALSLIAMEEAETAAPIATAPSIAAWTKWLDNHGIPFYEDVFTCAAEEVPGDFLGPLNSMKAGQWVRIDEPQRATVLELISFRLAPRSLADASSDIVRFLHNLSAA